MTIEIKEVTTKRDLKKFIRFPHFVHKGDSAWVPGLDFDEMNTLSKDKNPGLRRWKRVLSGERS